MPHDTLAIFLLALTGASIAAAIPVALSATSTTSVLLALSQTASPAAPQVTVKPSSTTLDKVPSSLVTHVGAEVSACRPLTKYVTEVVMTYLTAPAEHQSAATGSTKSIDWVSSRVFDNPVIDLKGKSLADDFSSNSTGFIGAELKVGATDDEIDEEAEGAEDDRVSDDEVQEEYDSVVGPTPTENMTKDIGIVTKQVTVYVPPSPTLKPKGTRTVKEVLTVHVQPSRTTSEPTRGFIQQASLDTRTSMIKHITVTHHITLATPASSTSTKDLAPFSILPHRPNQPVAPEVRRREQRMHRDEIDIFPPVEPEEHMRAYARRWREVYGDGDGPRDE